MSDEPQETVELEPRPLEQAVLPRWLWIAAAFGGLALFGLGLVLAAMPFAFPGALEAIGVVVAGYGLIAVTLGIGLVVAGRRGWLGRPASWFYPRRGGSLFLLSALVVSVLGALLPAQMQAHPLFAPFHFALILLPGLFLLSVVISVAGKPSSISLRRLVILLAGGASTLFIAIPVEIIGLGLSAGFGVAAVLLLPGGPAQVEQLMAILQGWVDRPPTDPSEVVALLNSPVVLITLTLTLAVITPLIEEFGKTLVMGVLGIWVKPSLLTAFIWGVACGLGFAWLEGVSNGAIGLGGVAGWLGSAGVRFLATAMHCATSGLLGLGWGGYWRGRWWALPLAYVGAVVVHGFWNFNVIVSAASLGLAINRPAVGGLLLVSAILFQGFLILLSFSFLIGLPRFLRKASQPVQG
jgi:hypothetical protein